MDIISYGVANKAGKSEQHTRNDVLGQGVEGSFLHTKDRIDKLEEGIQNVVSQADKLILHDAINIMKAHAQLNAIAKTTRYNMHNMIFDDLLDLSGVDTTRSSGYTHDSVNGLIKGGNIITKKEETEVVPSKVILSIQEEKNNLTLINPIMTSNTTPSPYRVIGIAGTNEDHSYYHAFDGNINTYYQSVLWPSINEKLGVGIDLGENNRKKVNKVVIKTGNIKMTRGIIQASNNGSYWVDLYTMNVDFNSDKTYEFDFQNNNYYRYYRTSMNYSNSNLNSISLKEVCFYETESLPSKYSVSRDDGITWEPIEPDTLFYFTDNISPQGNKLRLKAELPSGTKLLNYALTWA